MLDYNSLLTALTLLLTILIFCRSIIFRRQITEQSALLASQKSSLEALQDKLNQTQETKNRELDFQKNLKQAEVTTELQKSRSTLVKNHSKLKTPERYQYFQSMLQSGMHTQEMSSALGMSTTEITQLLKLSKIRCEAKECKEQETLLLAEA